MMKYGSMIKHWRWAAIISASVIGASALTACSGNAVKDTLGLERAAPDEFRVVSRPPLSVPPEFTLRPPTSTDAPLNQASASDQAKSLIVGGAPSNAPGSNVSGTATPVAEVSVKTSSAESQFLKDAGADRADPKVRDAMVEDQYAKQAKREECSWWQLACVTPDKKDAVVDAKKEADRIKTDADVGQPVTGDGVQEKKPRDTGVVGRIFGY